MPFSQRTDWKDLEAGGTPIYAADLLRIEQGIKDNENAAATGANHAAGNGSDHADVALNSGHRSSAHAPANADNTAANETSHTAEAAHRTGNGSDHADVAAATSALANLSAAGAVRAGITAITTGATCVINWATGAMVYTFTATENFTVSLTNLPAGAWGIVLMLTNGGAFSMSYSADWKEAGGAALTLTAAGTDRLVITGEGAVATTVIISVVSEDVK